MRSPRHFAPCLAALLAAASIPAASVPAAAALGVSRPQGPEAPVGVADSHRGPAVASGATGPARFVGPLLDAFDAEGAFAAVAFVDRYYRAPANDGYEAVLDGVLARLRAAGFRDAAEAPPGPSAADAAGGDAEADAGAALEVRVIETPLRAPAWTPLAARLELLRLGAPAEVLHAFEGTEGRDRVMLPVNAPSADVRGRVVTSLADVGPGTVLVSEDALSGGTLRRAARAGAVAVLSASVSDLTRDPTGAERHLDAISFRSVPQGTELAVAQISPRSYARIAGALAAGEAVEVALRAEVRFDVRPMRTVVASVVGTLHPDQAVVVAAHVQEPGAGDNASGVAGMLEGATALAGLITAGQLERPLRTVEFVWGDEMRQSAIWLDHDGRRAVAAFSADMLGQSTAQTGAICLLERSKDPGAIWTLPPDEHTPWGKGRVAVGDLVPDGLAVLVRTALADVAAATPGGWSTAEHPWEGGSDHDVFLSRGVPAVLVWHFTDFTYHTGLDRMDMLDAAELERSSVALVSAALAVADARPGDLPRHLESLRLDRELRLAAAHAANEPAAAAAWESWFEGAEAWLRALCGAGDVPGTRKETSEAPGRGTAPDREDGR